MSEYYTKEEAEKAVEALGVNMVDSSDHVSKSELRAWCEAYLKAIGHKQCNAYTIREATVIYDILEKFCKGEK